MPSFFTWKTGALARNTTCTLSRCARLSSPSSKGDTVIERISGLNAQTTSGSLSPQEAAHGGREGIVSITYRNHGGFICRSKTKYVLNWGSIHRLQLR